jgi:tetratricopeptide (TPR) repeat protein
MGQQTITNSGNVGRWARFERNALAKIAVANEKAKALGAASTIVLLSALCYANSLDGEFVFDDIPSILYNPTIRTLWSPAVFVPPRDRTVSGRPVANVSLGINYALGKTAVQGYHFLNVGVHTLAALALFGLLKRCFLLPGMPEALRSAATTWALIISWLWAAHPLQTESVSYTVQRCEALAGLFYLATLYCLVRGAGSARPRRWYFAAILACSLGMASKEAMVSAPLVAILLDRCLLSGSFAKAWRARRWLYVGLGMTWGLLAVLVFSSGARSGSVGAGHGANALIYAANQCMWICLYLRLSFIPAPLVFDYGTKLAPLGPGILLAICLIGVMVATTAVALVRWPRVGILGVGFFALLAPSSSFLAIATQVAAEHRMYLPLAGVITATIVGIAASGLPQRRPGLSWALCALAIAALACLTHLRNRDYRTALALWKDTAIKMPNNPRPRVNLAGQLLARRDAAGALAELEEAARLDPGDVDIIFDRGLALQELGRRAEALRAFDEALTQAPERPQYYLKRGETRHSLGQAEGAIADYTRCLALDPQQSTAFFLRGNSRRELGDKEAALADYTQAIALEPTLANAYTNRATIHAEQGRLNDAIQDCTQAIALRPGILGAYRNRAIFYYRSQRYELAWADIQTLAQRGDSAYPELAELVRKKLGK